MKLRTIRRFFTSTTTRLAGTYLAIIMLMSVGFSFVFYAASWKQLGRQLPPHSITGGSDNQQDSYKEPLDYDLDYFLNSRIHEGRNELLVRLIWLNIFALLAGSVLSFYLARSTLRPIEEAMDAQTQFVSDASHELRTPLTALHLTNEIALRKSKMTQAQMRDLIASNVEETVKLKNLTDGLLNLLREKGVLELRTVPLQEAASEAMSRIVAIASAKNISVQDDTGPENALANQQALVQVLTILLDNAVKYSPRKSKIFLSSSKSGKHVSLVVRDEGVGIEPADLKHIFKRFYRADRSRSQQSGYGLGLSIAHKLVSQMDGHISVTSEPKKGSAFIIRLPLAAK